MRIRAGRMLCRIADGGRTEKAHAREHPEAGLRLFNEIGEPKVTTAAIADELNISPGKLYDHFRSKNDIVNALFAAFEREIGEILATPARRRADVEDVWLFLHLLFETVRKCGFLYRDLDDLLSRNRLLPRLPP